MEATILSVKVQNFPSLYDKRHESYKEKGVTENAWKVVAEEFAFI